MASVQMAAPYRRPDFFGKGFIAEAKNTQGLFYEGREFEQIRDYAIAARALGVPLYVYTRVNTSVDRQFEGIVASTGGAVVRYFSVPNWSDPMDSLARNGLLLSVGGLLLLIGGSALTRPSAIRWTRQKRCVGCKISLFKSL